MTWDQGGSQPGPGRGLGEGVEQRAHQEKPRGTMVGWRARADFQKEPRFPAGCSPFLGERSPMGFEGLGIRATFLLWLQKRLGVPLSAW